jgi:hypothetical protein
MSKIYLVKLESGEHSLYETYKEVKLGSTISIGKGFFKIISEIKTDVHGREIKIGNIHFK